MLRTMEAASRRALVRLDEAFNRLYGSRWNPLYRSGAIAVALLLVLLVTGVYLLLFYRVGSPYASMERIQEQVWLGRWIRSLHRFAADAAVVAIVVHALRMFAQSRSWGPRAMAWMTGVILTGVFLICGWTGYVMVWDVQAQVMAMELARIVDVLPILSEPMSRAFVGERPLPSAFFFMNLFLHVALPIGLGLLLWLHVARTARPVLLPPRGLMWGIFGLLFGASVLWPVALAPEADVFRLPGVAEYDFFYSFWIPVTQGVSPWAAWGLIVLVTGLLLAVPLATRPRPQRKPAASVVNERLCTGCEQCVHDCPYLAISMVERSDGREGLVAEVDESLCVSCGICAASCAPMGIGPPGRTGRDQLAGVRDFVAANPPGPREVVMLGCVHGAGGLRTGEPLEGVHVMPVNCAGNVHTSAIEFLLRAGAGGVMVVSCPADDCRNREGVKWLEQRVYHGREAELQERVDRARVRLVEATAQDRSGVLQALQRFRAELPRVRSYEESDFDLIALCDRDGVEEEAR
jgi:coenzyme F420-reducing hydrogenase delta subunit/Pyruvate/2-oxoacid:ferredoxin oxidoreductase delta subunit